MKMKLTSRYALWTIAGLLTVLFLLTGGMKLTLLWEAFTQSGCGPSLLHLSLHFASETGVLGAIGGLILALVLILVIGGSLLAFAAYDRPASALPNKFV
jgi:hypothetical protein